MSSVNISLVLPPPNSSILKEKSSVRRMKKHLKIIKKNDMEYWSNKVSINNSIDLASQEIERQFSNNPSLILKSSRFLKTVDQKRVISNLKFQSKTLIDNMSHRERLFLQSCKDIKNMTKSYLEISEKKYFL